MIGIFDDFFTYWAFEHFEPTKTFEEIKTLDCEGQIATISLVNNLMLIRKNY